jgi:glycosyltransferase involved in cell wall biosynthesis
MQLDIVIPAHNEEHRIGHTLDIYRQGCSDPEVRFLVALDRCTDRTAEIVIEHARADQRIELLEFPKLGKGGVIMEAFRHCDGELVGFVDADCATPPNELLRLADLSRESDGAIASRRHPAAVLPRQRSMQRRLTSTGFARLTQLLFRLPYADTQCGAKVLRRDVMRGCLPFLSSRDFLFDVDLLVVARKLGFTLVEVPTVWVDQDGSRLEAGRDTRRMAMSSLSLWFHHRLSRVEPITTDPGTPVRELASRGSEVSNAA